MWNEWNEWMKVLFLRHEWHPVLSVSIGPKKARTLSSNSGFGPNCAASH